MMKSHWMATGHGNFAHLQTLSTEIQITSRYQNK